MDGWSIEQRSTFIYSLQLIHWEFSVSHTLLMSHSDSSCPRAFRKLSSKLPHRWACRDGEIGRLVKINKHCISHLVVVPILHRRWLTNAASPCDSLFYGLWGILVEKGSSSNWRSPWKSAHYDQICSSFVQATRIQRKNTISEKTWTILGGCVVDVRS